jgi:hypothetical protein
MGPSKKQPQSPGVSYGFSGRSQMDKFGQTSAMVCRELRIFREELSWFDDA